MMYSFNQCMFLMCLLCYWRYLLVHVYVILEDILHYLFHFLDRPFWFYYRCKESSFRMKFIFWSHNFLQYCCMTCFYHQLIIFWWSLTLTIYLDIFTNTFVQGILSFKVCFIIGESYLYSECNFKTSGWWLYKCWW